MWYFFAFAGEEKNIKEEEKEVKKEKVQEKEEETNCPGSSVIKAKYTGFTYTSRNKEASPNEKVMKVSPRMKKMKITSVRSPIVIQDSDSESSSPNLRTKRKAGESMAIRIDSSPLSSSTIHHVDNSPRGIKRKLSFEENDDLPSLSPSSSPTNSVCDKGDDNGDDNDDIQYYQGDTTLPTLKVQEGIKTLDVLNILLKPIDEQQIAKNIPFNIDRNVSFVYRTTYIGGHWKNALCDGMGVWKQMGKETKFVDVSETGFPRAEEIMFIKENNITETSLKVVRHKYINKSFTGLHRIVIHLEEPNTNEALDLFFRTILLRPNARQCNKD